MKKYTDEYMEQLYDDYLENCSDRATDDIIEARTNLERSLDAYIEALQKWEFNRGFRYAVTRAEQGVL